jgi:hypothetical protein
MRVPPAGFDTTGDGHSIFGMFNIVFFVLANGFLFLVTYHDSQAYAEYLITYR